MYRFYVEENQINGKNAEIIGSDVNHIKNVLRMDVGERIIICNGQGVDFYCIITSVSSERIELSIEEEKETDSELPVKLYLFQALPKKDKMELIIQKAIELGAYEVIPVKTKRCVVKLEEQKKITKKIERWQSIAESAAKQSCRGVIPRVHDICTLEEALQYAGQLECRLIPYELEENMELSKEIIDHSCQYKSIGILIGPEGGFEKNEVERAMEAGFLPISLGKRILRTETAGLAILSILMFRIQ